jgi:hypothetical protein
VDGAVRIERARFSLLGGLELSGVGIASTGIEGNTSSPPDLLHPDIAVRTLLIRHDPAALLRGRFLIEEVIASDVICHVIRDEQAGSYNLRRLFRVPAKTGRRQTGDLPTVSLRDAVLVVTRQNQSGRREVERVGITASAAPDNGQPAAYTIAWNTTGPEGTSGRSRLLLDPLTLTDLEGGLPWMSLETVMLGADSRIPSARNWFTLLGLSGEIRAQDYSVSVGARAEAPRVTIRLRDASLSVPIDEVEQGLPAEERYLRFEHVEGEVQICGDVAEADFGARFHEADCRVSASLTGDDAARANLGDVGFHIELDCEGLELPTDDPAISAVEARFVRRWRRR